MDSIKTGKFLYELRKSKNISQKDLATILNVSDKTISKWECGEGFPSLEYLLALSKFYEITIDEILEGELKQKQVVQVPNTTKGTNSIQIMPLISLIVGIVGLIISLVLMYVAHSISGSAISILITTIISSALTVISWQLEEKNNKSLILSNLIMLLLNAAIAVVILGSYIAVMNSPHANIYVTAIYFVVCVMCFAPMIVLSSINIYKCLRDGTNVFDTIEPKIRKYIDITNVILCLVLSLALAFETGVSDEFLFSVLGIYGLIVTLSITDFFLKKEIPFLIPSICLLGYFVLTVYSLTLSTIYSVATIPFVASIVFFAIYSMTFYFKRKRFKTNESKKD